MNKIRPMLANTETARLLMRIKKFIAINSKNHHF